MIFKKVNHPNQNGQFVVFEGENIEFINPYVHFKNQYVFQAGIINLDLLISIFGIFHLELIKTAFNRAEDEWAKKLEELETDVPDILKELLNTNKKGELAKLLSNKSFSTFQIVGFFYLHINNLVTHSVGTQWITNLNL